MPHLLAPTPPVLPEVTLLLPHRGCYPACLPRRLGGLAALFCHARQLTLHFPLCLAISAPTSSEPENAS